MDKFFESSKIRNIAIIAHIDHGKTTLLDSLLKQSNIFRDNEKVPERIMDSYDQERERGITIFAKHTSIFYHDYKINIIDTPGHADFSGEVERILGMVNSVLLLVDAQEGPMPQTRYVLSRALRMNLNPIVVINKIDRPHANPHRALDLTFDLFIELGATDEQLNFSYVFASGVNGYAMNKLEEERKDLQPLFELILSAVPKPPGNIELPFLMQVSTVYYDEFLGRQGCGRILEGKIQKNEQIAKITKNGRHTVCKINKIESFLGLKKVEIPVAAVGDIILISGMEDIDIGDTLCNPDNLEQLPPISLSEPTLSIEISANTGPFFGKDGSNVSMNRIKDRLMYEKRANISLKIEEIPGREDAIKVCGRGELHLAVLLEAMRREDYEMAISRPQVILKHEGSTVLEPIEHLYIEVPEVYSGMVIEDISKRKGELLLLSTNEQKITSLEFLIPTRTLLGYRSEFLTKTSGLGILTSLFKEYSPWKGNFLSRSRGVLIASSPGKVTAYSLFNLQERGTIFVNPQDLVYEGMIVGEHSRENDLIVNPTKAKHMSNVRSSGADEHLILTPPKTFTLEMAIEYIQDDELAEITPHFIRLRKKFLLEIDRKRSSRD